MDGAYIKPYAYIQIADGLSIEINTSTYGIWVIGGILIILSIIVRIMLTRFSEKPKGLQNLIELVVEMFDGFVKSTVGEKYSGLGPWFFGVCVFILISNLSSLTGARPPTADISVNAGLAIVTFFMIQIISIKENKWDYLKGFFQPIPIFLPMNLIGEVATPISLSMRLFCVMLSGGFMMGLIYDMLPTFLLIILPAPIHMYLDLFTSVLQAGIFTMLSLTFIKLKLPEDS